MQHAVARFRRHGISSSSLAGREWDDVHPLCQNKTFIEDTGRVVDQILQHERIIGEDWGDHQFESSRRFISVFQAACFPLPEYDEPEPGLIDSAKAVLAQFEGIVHSVAYNRFDPIMTFDFRSRLARFIRFHKQSVDSDIVFLMDALKTRDMFHEYMRDLETLSLKMPYSDEQRYLHNESSIDRYLGGIRNDSFIVGI